MELKSPIGLIAGNGSFPIEFARNARERGIDVVAVAHQGETDSALSEIVKHCEWIKVGELGKLIKTFKTAGVTQAAFAGGIKRINLFGGVKLDLKGMGLLAKVRSVKDDSILRGIANEIESSGINVFSATELLSDSVVEEGYLTKRELSKDEMENARIGWEAAKTLGKLDIGQTAIVNQGMVVALEAVEGTDKAILRAGELSGKGAVVVKVCKPGQDLRIDLPTIGKKTVQTMQQIGATALIIEAKKTIILEKEELISTAESSGISILGTSNLP